MEALEMRVFKVYKYVLGKKTDVAAIFRKIADKYPPRRVIFHIGGMDRIYGENAIGLPRERQLELSPTVKSLGFLSKYAYPRLFRFSDAPSSPEIAPECQSNGQDCLGTEFRASNLDRNWDAPALYGQGESLALDEAFRLLAYGGKSPERYSGMLVGFDEVPWFDTARPGTHGYRIADSGNGAGYLSSSALACRNIDAWTVYVSYEVTPEDRGMPKDETACVDALAGMLGRHEEGELTLYAPEDHMGRAVWRIAERQCSEIFTYTLYKVPRYAGEVLCWPEQAPWAFLGEQSPLDLEGIMAAAFKGTQWEAGTGRYFIRDSFGTTYSLWPCIQNDGRDISLRFECAGRIFALGAGADRIQSWILQKGEINLGHATIGSEEGAKQYFSVAAVVFGRIVEELKDMFGKVFASSGIRF